ncbi:MAG: hypothetical protein HRT35_08730 [Algicola sp.]|nr:hypothetical protein [Algicola sp.]
MNIDGVLTGIASVVAEKIAQKAAEPNANITETEKSAPSHSPGVLVTLSAEGLFLSKATQASSNQTKGIAALQHQPAKSNKTAVYERIAGLQHVEDNGYLGAVATKLDKTEKPISRTDKTAQEGELKSKIAELSKVKSDPKLSEQEKQQKISLINSEITVLEQNLLLDTNKLQSSKLKNKALETEPDKQPNTPAKSPLGVQPTPPPENIHRISYTI